MMFSCSLDKHSDKSPYPLLKKGKGIQNEDFQDCHAELSSASKKWILKQVQNDKFGGLDSETSSE